MDFFIQCFSLFQKGGPVMYLILLCSLIVVGVGVERFLYYKEINTNMNGFIDELQPSLERHEWESALEVCRQKSGIIADLAEKGIKCFQRDNYNIESVLEGEASLAVANLKENLPHLDTIVTIAPLLGLLGTVIGMIDSFSVMNIKNGQPLAITEGVAEALIATAAGLCVAILAMFVYSYFNHRLNRTITNIEQICTLLITHVISKAAKKNETA